MVGEALAGIGALKTAFDIAKGLKEIDDATRRNAAIIDLQEKILSAQASQGKLAERVDELEEEIDRLKAWDEDKKRYKLATIKDGVYAYSLKEPTKDEPAHYICASCFQSDHKSLLQKERWPPTSVVLVCHDCGATLYEQGQPHKLHQSMKPPAYRPK